ncbi:hypothetical protein HYQ46_009618 [Verticillium longisporum]|nr:hypothetical protein HYQ46_009618 [Verticillium longisporum]
MTLEKNGSMRSRMSWFGPWAACSHWKRRRVVLAKYASHVSCQPWSMGVWPWHVGSKKPKRPSGDVALRCSCAIRCGKASMAGSPSVMDLNSERKK